MSTIGYISTISLSHSGDHILSSLKINSKNSLFPVSNNLLMIFQSLLSKEVK